MPLKIKPPKIKRITDRIYLAVFSNRFDLTMTFMRYQEYYESPKYRNKVFSLAEFMRWYSLTYGNGAFTYPKDWNGFNIPAPKIFEVIKQLNENQNGWNDSNIYDFVMRDLVVTIKKLVKDDNFYIIGIHEDDDDESTRRHEVAHGLFWTNKEYKKKMTKLVIGLPKGVRIHLQKILKKRGYCRAVFVDEIHAYMTTGLMYQANKKLLKKRMDPFKRVFREYYK